MKTRKLIVAALAALICTVSSAKPKSDQPAKINVISYNIRNSASNDGTNSWQYRFPATLLMVEDQKPDVMGVQEALPAQMLILNGELRGYKSIGVPRDDGKKEGECMAIFYNKKTVKLMKWGTYWLSETPDVPSKGWDAACFRTATWALFKDKRSGRKFYMVNTHLDHIGVEARRNGLQLLLERIAKMDPSEEIPLILNGDFNVEQSDPSIQVLSPKMNNARIFARTTDTGITYNAWGRKDSQSTIDYIFYRGFRECPTFEVVRKSYYELTYISDHFPVRAELVF
ncbi:MAG: endonuclease/exonuclease/phosphatase family protein [Bacteroidales bacterium]|nr:endonuclease/exonuclease/phosphatase family protein [Bacteroidales bacterium]